MKKKGATIPSFEQKYFMEIIISISAIRFDIVREQLFFPKADGIAINLRRIAPPGTIANLRMVPMVSISNTADVSGFCPHNGGLVNKAEYVMGRMPFDA